MGFAIPKRNYGWTLLLAAAIAGGGMFRKGLPPPDKLVTKFGENWQVGASAFVFLLVISWAWHGVTESPKGHRPLGALVVLIAFGGLAIAATASVIAARGPVGHNGAALQFATGLWFLLAMFGVSFAHAKYGKKGHARSTMGFSLPKRRKMVAGPTFLQLPGSGGDGH